MSPADGIRKLGFHRWYERQLIESHAYLVTCFLCMIRIAACAEGFSLRGGGWTPLLRLAMIIGAGVVGVASVKRYGILLARAEHIAELSTCKQCSTYGRLRVIDAGGSEPAHASSGLWIRVQCRKCGNQWLIE